MPVSKQPHGVSVAVSRSDLQMALVELERAASPPASAAPAEVTQNVSVLQEPYLYLSISIYKKHNKNQNQLHPTDGSEVGRQGGVSRLSSVSSGTPSGARPAPP